jgi:integrase
VEGGSVRAVSRHDTTVLSWDQLRKVLAKLTLEDRLILELDMIDALRPSELFGLRWREFNQRRVPARAWGATLGQKKGTPKAIQSVSQHSRLLTTTNILHAGDFAKARKQRLRQLTKN